MSLLFVLGETMQLVKNSKGEYCKKPKTNKEELLPIDEEKFLKDIKKYYGYDGMMPAFNKLQELYSEAKPYVLEEEPVQKSLQEQIEEIVEQFKPFQNIKVIKTPNKKLFVYEQEEQYTIIGSIENVTAKIFALRLSELMGESYVEMYKQICQVYSPKCPASVSETEAMQLCLNITVPANTCEIITIPQEDIHPVTIQGCDVTSLRKLPYQHDDTVTIDSLNPYLKEFLLRVDNYQHLCAVLWGQFTGKRWPYLCYLYGEKGREGKTAFINMLGRLTNSYATLTYDNRFGYFSLYGKSIIMVPENDKSRLASSKVIKEITGGNLLNIEEKGKTGFSGAIIGTLLVDANVKLKIEGKSFETDRLIYLTVAENPVSPDERLSPEIYTQELSSTPNEFLNFCRQCFDALIMPQGMLKQPITHADTMRSLTDTETEYDYEDLLATVCTQLKYWFADDLSCSRALLVAHMRRAAKRDFYAPGFDFFLKKRGIFEQDGRYVGVGPQPDGHTQIVIEPSQRLEKIGLKKYLHQSKKT